MLKCYISSVQKMSISSKVNREEARDSSLQSFSVTESAFCCFTHSTSVRAWGYHVKLVTDMTSQGDTINALACRLQGPRGWEHCRSHSPRSNHIQIDLKLCLTAESAHNRLCEINVTPAGLLFVGFAEDRIFFKYFWKKSWLYKCGFKINFEMKNKHHWLPDFDGRSQCTFGCCSVGWSINMAGRWRCNTAMNSVGKCRSCNWSSSCCSFSTLSSIEGGAT